MSQANLSETLFKPRFKHPETSTLVRRFSAGKPQAMQSALSGNHVDHWYRLINRLMWIWRGVTPQEILDVQARIVMSEAERTIQNCSIPLSAIAAATGSLSGRKRPCSGNKRPGRKPILC